jgi:isoleucyl-tRNA synthetase
MNARQGVLRGLEAARSKGVIGHPLDAHVQIKLSDYYKGLAGKVSDEMWEMVLIVSSCEVVDEVKGAEVVYEDETTGLVIGVDKSKDEKCPRCWKRRPEVAEKGLCSRCKDVIGD